MRMKTFAALVICLGISLNCYAGTYYVSNDGNDNNNGLSEAAPFASLYKVNQTVSTGDQVFLKRGDTWNVTHNKIDGEALGDGLYIKVDNILVGTYGSGSDPKPIIDATDKTDRNEKRGTQYYSCIQVGIRYGHASSGVTIQDLDLRGPALGCSIHAYNAGDDLTVSRCDLRGSGWAAEALVIAASSDDHYVFEDCFFDQITGNSSGYSKSIEIRGGSGHIIRGNTFYGYTGGGALRFSEHGTGALIEGNFFYHPDTRHSNAWALVIRSCDGGTYIVRNNVIDMTNHGGLTSTTALRGMVFWYDYVSTTRLIYNNTFISSGKAGCAVNSMGSGSSVVNFFNNIVIDVDVGYNNDTANLHLRNNVFYECDGITENGSEGTNSNTVTTNPHLSDPSMSNHQASDAMLTAESINAIDAGYENAPDIPTIDFAGNTRDDVDIGAFEYSGGPPSNQPPQASFNATPSSGQAPLTVQFTDTSTDPDGTIASWSWVFGDGETSTEQNPTHTYDNPNTYTAELTVTDDDGAPDSASTTISVSDQGSNQPPQAAFTATPSSGQAPLTVQFTDTSTDPDGTIASWSWVFGDGETSTEQNPTHTYDNPNTYTAALTVTDNDGAPDSTSTTISASSGETTSIYVEAESGTLYTPMTIGTDSNPSFSGSGYVYAPAGSGETSNPTAEAVYNIDIPYAGDYYLWLRMYGPSSDNDAMYIGFNGSFDRVYVSQWTAYEWVRVETTHGSGDFSHTLSAGTNQVNIGHGEELARADMILITSDAGFSPTDDTTAPVIAIAQPTSGDAYSTDEDTVDLGGSASDDVGVISVTWTNNRGGSGAALGTGAWTISDIVLHCGEDNIITVTAQDAAGNPGTDTLTVDVKPCPVGGFDTP